MPSKKTQEGTEAQAEQYEMVITDEAKQIIYEGMMNIDTEYIESWVNEAKFWHRNGVYKKIAEAIDLKTGQVHVDIGAGLGNLACAIKDREPQNVVIGVEVKQLMLAAAMSVTETLGHKAIYHGAFDVVVTPDRCVDLRCMFREDLAEGIEFMIPEPTIKFICDDIRRAEAIEEILGDTKIDSGSFVFPGGTNQLAFRTPFGPEIKTLDELHRRHAIIAPQVKDAAYGFLAKHTKQGGRMVLAERASFGNGDPIEITMALFRSSIGDHVKYWDYEDADFNISQPVSMSSEDNDYKWVATNGDHVEGDQDTYKGNIILAAMNRNSLPFEETQETP